MWSADSYISRGIVVLHLFVDESTPYPSPMYVVIMYVVTSIPCLQAILHLIHR